MERLGIVAENKLYSGDRSNKEWGWKNNFLEDSKKFRGVGSQDSQRNLMRNELGE